jgi:hypothetical protein
VQHVSRDENTVMNDLAQQVLGFRSNRGKFDFLEKPDVPACQTEWSDFRLMYNATICSAEPSSVKLDGLVLETRWSKNSKNPDESSETTTTNPDDWRPPLVRYLENPSHIADRKVWRQALK